MGEMGILGPEVPVELIEGEIIDMTPTGSRHAGIVRHLAKAIEQVVGGQGLVSVQSPVRLGSQSEPEPDVALLRYRPDFYKKAHPGPEDVLLIVEVADASIRYDREVKLPLYARHRIAEVWLIDLNQGEINVHRDPERGIYSVHEVVTDVSTVALPSLGGRVDLSGLFE